MLGKLREFVTRKRVDLPDEAVSLIQGGWLEHDATAGVVFPTDKALRLAERILTEWLQSRCWPYEMISEQHISEAELCMLLAVITGDTSWNRLANTASQRRELVDAAIPAQSLLAGLCAMYGPVVSPSEPRRAVKLIITVALGTAFARLDYFPDAARPEARTIEVVTTKLWVLVIDILTKAHLATFCYVELDETSPAEESHVRLILEQARNQSRYWTVEQ